MTHYRPCAGCKHQKTPCETRDNMKEKIAGLGVTVIGWKCKDRAPVLNRGDIVKVTTIADLTWDDPQEDVFKGYVVGSVRSKAIVYIKTGTVGENYQELFVPHRNGFCKVPLSRIAATSEPPVELCDTCDTPRQFDHEGEGCPHSYLF